MPVELSDIRPMDERVLGIGKPITHRRMKAGNDRPRDYRAEIDTACNRQRSAGAHLRLLEPFELPDDVIHIGASSYDAN